MEQTKRKRRAKRDRRPIRTSSSSKVHHHKSNDPDHELIHAFPPSATKQNKNASLGKCVGDYLAFASIDSTSLISQEEQRQYYAGMSSAAASIVIELSTPPKRGRGKPPSKKNKKEQILELLSSNNRKRTTPVTTEEIQNWRNNSISTSGCYRFKPVYTHHFFTDEKVMGYKPTDLAIEEAKALVSSIKSLSSRGDGNNNDDQVLPHPSFSHHEIAGHTLSIQVRLAPSCRMSCLIVEINKVGGQQSNNSHNGGRVAVDSNTTTHQQSKTCSHQALPPIPPDVASLKIVPKADRTKKENGLPYCKVEGCKLQSQCSNDGMCRRHFNLFRKAGRSTNDPPNDEVGGQQQQNNISDTVEDVARNVHKPKTKDRKKQQRKSQYTPNSKEYQCPKCLKEFHYPVARTAAATFTRHVRACKKRKSKKKSRPSSESQIAAGVSWDGDDEYEGEEYELKNSNQGGGGGSRKRRRARSQSKSVLQTLAKSDHVVPVVKEEQSRSSRGRRRGVQSPRPVTDVSDGPSSDEDNEMQQPQAVASSSSTAALFPHLARMKVSRIITQVAAGFPGVAGILLKDEYEQSYKILSSSVHSIEDIENDYLDEPVGKVIREYSREKTTMSLVGSGGIECPSNKGKTTAAKKTHKSNFVLTLADMRLDNEGRKYLDEVERLSPWFIEVASRVEVGVTGGIEADGGYWKVLFLFEKHCIDKANKYSLVGYVTLFYQGLQMTVCQAVCLPPYQRAGHGTEMLLAAYNVCEGREILVESPAPAFVALRNRIDYSLVSKLIEEGSQIIPSRFTQPARLFGVNGDTPLPDDVLVKVGSELHITPSQVAIAFDIWKLGQLEEYVRDSKTLSNNDTITSAESIYKSSVKRTLLKTLRESQNESNFDSMSIEEQKEHLENCFNCAVVRYRAVLKKL